MPNQIQIAYSIAPFNTLAGLNPFGSTTAAAVRAAMAAVALYTSPTQDQLLCQSLGLTVAADATVIGGGNVITRTLTLNMNALAGAPLAPSYFPIHAQTQDGFAALYSSSQLDSALGIGAQLVSITYQNVAGVAQTVQVATNGRSPVQLPTPGGVKAASVTAMSIVRAGSVGSSVGQLTVGVFNPTAPSLVNAQGAPIVNPTQDQLQLALGDKLGMLPVSYLGNVLSPGALAPTNANLQAAVTNLFTQKLSLALAAQVTATAPVLI